MCFAAAIPSFCIAYIMCAHFFIELCSESAIATNHALIYLQIYLVKVSVPLLIHAVDVQYTALQCKYLLYLLANT